MVIENITYFLFIFSILVIGRSLLRLISFLLQNVNDSKLLYSNGVHLVFLFMYALGYPPLGSNADASKL